MIVDCLADAGKYYGMHRLFGHAFEFLKSANLNALSPGRHEIDGDDLFVIIDRATGRPEQQAKLEAHRNYIDIQYLMAGEERMGWAPAVGCSSDPDGYDQTRDIVFFTDRPRCWIVLAPGEFALFFPGDAHAPLVSGGQVSKAVIKVRV